MATEIRTDTAPRRSHGAAIERASAAIDRAARESLRPTTVLIIGEAPTRPEDVDLRGLGKRGVQRPVEVTVARTASQAFTLLSSSSPDVILADVGVLSRCPAGTQALTLLRERASAGCSVVFGRA